MRLASHLRSEFAGAAAGSCRPRFLVLKCHIAIKKFLKNQLLLKDNNNRISLTLTHTLNKMYALRISEISFPDTFRSLFGTRAFLLPFGPNSLSLRHGPRWQQLALSSRRSLHLPSGKLFLYPDSLYYQLIIYIFALLIFIYYSRS